MCQSRKVKLSHSEVVFAAAVCALASILISAAQGRDLNWDYFSYHGYAALQNLQYRAADFFAAGYQGYLNPLPFAPFAAMEAAGWHSLAIASSLATIQSANALFLYLICRDITANSRSALPLAAMLTVCGCASSVFIGQLGSSFVDTMTTPPVMAAIWLLARRQDLKALVSACGLVGTATGLKLTNAPFALGVVVVVLVIVLRHKELRLRDFGLSIAALILGFAAVYGAWGLHLQSQYGSPFFPLFNQVFQASDFPSRSTAFHRFIPQDALAMLSLPFRLVTHESWIYTEIIAPDIRPSVVYVLTGAIVLRAILSGFRIHRAHQFPILNLASVGSGTIVGIFFLVSLAGWIATSTNGRYATPILLLLGPLVYCIAVRLLGQKRGAILALVVTLLQTAQVAQAGNPRWEPRDWTEQWLSENVPLELKRAPHLFLTVGASSESFVAAHVHPDSVLSNPIGALSIPTDGPGWSRLTALLEKFDGRTRVQLLLQTEPTAETFRRASEAMSDFVERLNLEVERGSCVTMEFEVEGPAIPYWWDRSATGQSARPRRLLNCATKTRSEPDATLRQRRQLTSTIMDAYERRCPGVFQPEKAQVEGSGSMWNRYYGKFDLHLVINFGNGHITYKMARQSTPILIGQIASWEQDVASFKCQLPHGGWRGLSASISEDAPK